MSGKMGGDKTQVGHIILVLQSGSNSSFFKGSLHIWSTVFLAILSLLEKSKRNVIQDSQYYRLVIVSGSKTFKGVIVFC